MQLKGLAELILGLWLLVSVFLAFDHTSSALNNFFVGIIAAWIGFIGTHKKAGWSFFVGILGLWLMVAAFIPFLEQGLGLFLNDILTGSIIIIIGLGVLFHTMNNSHNSKRLNHLNYRNYGSE